MLMVSSGAGRARRATLNQMPLVGDVAAQLEKELSTSSQLSHFDDMLRQHAFVVKSTSLSFTLSFP